MSAPIFDPISAIGAVDGAGARTGVVAGVKSSAAARPAGAPDFAKLLASGVEAVNEKALTADAVARAFALDDSIPVHQVTYALAEARLSLELMIQVRNRLVEGYQDLMRMQL